MLPGGVNFAAAQEARNYNVVYNGVTPGGVSRRQSGGGARQLGPTWHGPLRLIILFLMPARCPFGG